MQTQETTLMRSTSHTGTVNTETAVHLSNSARFTRRNKGEVFFTFEFKAVVDHQKCVCLPVIIIIGLSLRFNITRLIIFLVNLTVVNIILYV